MAYIENPIVEGKDFESVMNDVNGNFDFLKDDIENLKKKPFVKIGEYKIQTQVFWTSSYNSSYVAPDKLKYSYYKIDNGKSSLLDSGEKIRSGYQVTYKNIISTKVPCDRVFYLIRINGGRKNCITINYGVNSTNSARYVYQESPKNILGETNIATSQIFIDHENIASYERSCCYETSHNQSSIIIKRSTLQHMVSEYKVDGYKIVGFKEQDANLEITVYGDLIPKGVGAYWEKNSEGEPLYVNMLDYSKLHPEEFASTIDISVYTLETDFDINGIDWDNPWTEI